MTESDINEQVEKLGLQSYAITELVVCCHRCRDKYRSGQSATSLAMYPAARAGWRVDDKCQVWCPKCIVEKLKLSKGENDE